MADDLVGNLKLLIKMLGMTRSASDAEALVAIRRANEHLDKFKATWEDLLTSKVTINIAADPFSGLRQPPQSADRAPIYTPQTPPRPVQPTAAGYTPSKPSKSTPAAFMNARSRAYADDPARKLDAIREVRLASGCLLQEAVKCVEDYIAANGFDPFKTTRTPQGATHRTPQTNKFASVCRKCGTRVDIGKGHLYGSKGAWQVECLPGTCVTSKYSRTRIDIDDLANI